jgi:hypothetical protein
MAIDNPVDAVESQYQESLDFPVGLVLAAGEIALPQGAPLFKLLSLLNDHFSSKEKRDRAKAFWAALRDQQKFLEADFSKLRVRVEDLAEALQLAVLRDVESFNDAKRDRYLKILGNAVRSREKVEDLVAFIQDVERLGESDIVVLKVLNVVMNKVGDWHPKNDMNVLVPGHQSPVTKPISINPSVLIQRSQELSVQTAQALGIKTDTGIPAQAFSREEAFSACARLQGFGLAHEVNAGSREVPHGNFCFRPSKRGLMLLKLLGEDVPNWELYFPPAKG